MYFTSYEFTKKLIKQNNMDSNTYIAQSLAGVTAGLGFWLPIYPIDVVKNNVQIDNFDKPKFKNTLDCIKYIYKSDGMLGFYRGFLPCMVRSIPVHIGIFTSYKYVIDNF
jgi:solute carrier family 25 carnitine/acylcarnitine transporter 20/29